MFGHPRHVEVVISAGGLLAELSHAKLEALVPRPGSPASSSVTRALASVSRYAVAAPTIPPPITITSVAVRALICPLFARVDRC